MTTEQEKIIAAKAAKMQSAFTDVIYSFDAEGRHDIAKRTAHAICGVSDESFARLYDIVQNVFAPTPKPLEEVVGPTENIGSCHYLPTVFPFKGEASRSDAMTEARSYARQMTLVTGRPYTYKFDGGDAYVVMPVD